MRYEYLISKMLSTFRPQNFPTFGLIINFAHYDTYLNT